MKIIVYCSFDVIMLSVCIRSIRSFKQVGYIVICCEGRSIQISQTYRNVCNFSQLSFIVDIPDHLILDKSTRHSHFQHCMLNNRTHLNLPANDISVRQGTVAVLTIGVNSAH